MSTGDDEVSAQMDATWEDEEVSKLCQDAGMVAIKFNANRYVDCCPVGSTLCMYAVLELNVDSMTDRTLGSMPSGGKSKMTVYSEDLHF